MEKIILKTEDGVDLAVHVFIPENTNHKVLLINSATGVKQQIYFSFAHFLQSRALRSLLMIMPELVFQSL
jgi:predicted alpha/beta hydrolase